MFNINAVVIKPPLPPLTHPFPSTGFYACALCIRVRVCSTKRHWRGCRWARLDVLCCSPVMLSIFLSYLEGTATRARVGAIFPPPLLLPYVYVLIVFVPRASC